MKRIALLVLAALCVAPVSRATSAEADTKPATAPTTAPTTQASDNQRLQGTWVVVKRVKDGVEQTVKEGASTMTFAGEQIFSTEDAKNNGSGRFVLDEKKEPKQITMTATSGPYVGRTFSALYKIEGDTLRLAYSTAENSETRPRDLEGGQDEAMSVLEKQKP